MTASITASDTNTAGETYSLMCSVTVTGSTDQPTITWFGPMNNPVSPEMVTTTGSTSTLTFNPLSARSHAGTYTCRASAGSLSGNRTFTVQVNVRGISVIVCTRILNKMWSCLSLSLLTLRDHSCGDSQ